MRTLLTLEEDEERESPEAVELFRALWSTPDPYRAAGFRLAETEEPFKALWSTPDPYRAAGFRLAEAEEQFRALSSTISALSSMEEQNCRARALGCLAEAEAEGGESLDEPPLSSMDGHECRLKATGCLPEAEAEEGVDWFAALSLAEEHPYRPAVPG